MIKRHHKLLIIELVSTLGDGVKGLPGSALLF